jgi:hypothetical protein
LNFLENGILPQNEICGFEMSGKMARLFEDNLSLIHCRERERERVGETDRERHT